MEPLLLWSIAPFVLLTALELPPVMILGNLYREGLSKYSSMRAFGVVPLLEGALDEGAEGRLDSWLWSR